jgi:hypothetical protein
MKPLQIVGWDQRNDGSICRGETWVQTPSGLILGYLPIFVKSGKVRCGHIGRPALDHTGQNLRRKPDGKPEWQAVVTFVDEQTRVRFNRQVLEALTATYPDALGEGAP